jgi:hypothetical protein
LHGHIFAAFLPQVLRAEPLDFMQPQLADLHTLFLDVEFREPEHYMV